MGGSKGVKEKGRERKGGQGSERERGGGCCFMRTNAANKKLHQLALGMTDAWLLRSILICPALLWTLDSNRISSLWYAVLD